MGSFSSPCDGGSLAETPLSCSTNRSQVVECDNLLHLTMHDCAHDSDRLPFTSEVVSQSRKLEATVFSIFTNSNLVRGFNAEIVSLNVASGKLVHLKNSRIILRKEARTVPRSMPQSLCD